MSIVLSFLETNREWTIAGAIIWYVLAAVAIRLGAVEELIKSAEDKPLDRIALWVISPVVLLFVPFAAIAGIMWLFGHLLTGKKYR